MKNRHPDCEIIKDLIALKELLTQESHFLSDGVEATKKVFDNHQRCKNTSEQTMFAFAWDMEGYMHLLKTNRGLSETVQEIEKRVTGRQERGNLPKDLSMLRQELETYVKGVYSKKREAASHLLVFMISDELRDFKPYAIPVRVITYKSISDGKLRDLKNELKTEMKKLGMKVIGKM